MRLPNVPDDPLLAGRRVVLTGARSVHGCLPSSSSSSSSSSSLPLYLYSSLSLYLSTSLPLYLSTSLPLYLSPSPCLSEHQTGGVGEQLQPPDRVAKAHRKGVSISQTQNIELNNITLHKQETTHTRLWLNIITKHDKLLSHGHRYNSRNRSTIL